MNLIDLTTEKLEKKTEYLFVYGTLMSTFRNKYPSKSHEQQAAFLAMKRCCSLVGLSETEGRLITTIGGYPGLVEPKNSVGKRVSGELYKIGKEKSLMNYLDRYEGYSASNRIKNEYTRSKRVCFLKRNKETYLAWVYIYNK